MSDNLPEPPIGPQRAAPKSLAAIEAEVAQYRKFADSIIAKESNDRERSNLEALRDMFIDDIREQAQT